MSQQTRDASLPTLLDQLNVSRQTELEPLISKSAMYRVEGLIEDSQTNLPPETGVFSEQPETSAVPNVVSTVASLKVLSSLLLHTDVKFRASGHYYYNLCLANEHFFIKPPLNGVSHINVKDESFKISSAECNLCSFNNSE